MQVDWGGGGGHAGGLGEGGVQRSIVCMTIQFIVVLQTAASALISAVEQLQLFPISGVANVQKLMGLFQSWPRKLFFYTCIIEAITSTPEV